MSSCRNTIMCCFAPVRPLYKVKVDGIFPSVPQDGIVTQGKDSLIYYATTNPEKFDRIGDYLRQRISRHVYRGRKQLAFIGTEAMDQLLLSCQRQNLNLFVESFLECIQELLESSDLDYQVKASLSFEKFSNKTEDAPCYYRKYDFFIEKFSQMCHSLDVNLRISGLQGLMSVIRKTVNEELAENIWDQTHMGKIVPSLLINLEERSDVDDTKNENSTSPIENIDSIASPGRQADQILRELVRSASGWHLKTILSVVLQHVDLHNQWDGEEQERALYIFHAIAYSMQVDLSYILIQSLLSHLKNTTSISTKCNIATVLSKVIGIGVDASTVGVAVLEITSTLLQNLCAKLTNALSIEKLASSEKMPGEIDEGKLVLEYQNLLLYSVGQYTANMPDFQKEETLASILSKIPTEYHTQNVYVYDTTHSMDSNQHILMKAFFVVAEKHYGRLFSSSFNLQLLVSLFKLLHVQDHDVRLLVLQSTQVLADQSQNLEKLLGAGLTITPSNIGLNSSAVKLSDQIFAKKYLSRTYNAFSSVLSQSFNTKEFLDSMYISVAIIAVEMKSIEKTAGFLLNLIEDVQTAAMTQIALGTDNRLGLHALAISLLALLAFLLPDISEIDTHLQDLINTRSNKATHLLPPIQDNYNLGLDPNALDDDITIKPNIIKDAMKNAGKDIEQSNLLTQASEKRNSFANSRSVSYQFQVSVESLFGEPVEPNKEETDGRSLKQDITSFEAFKDVLSGTSSETKDLKLKKEEELKRKFLYASFTDLCTEAENNESDLENFVHELFSRLSFGQADFVGPNDKEFSVMEDPEPYQRYFPDLYTC